ncbi:hypothetical protein C7C56_011060 [Massilia glaciei]|uniref:Uncharacterized protein n=1 Tax=Massilia glaciei TaxID=1524097 RepID=A0A2U2HMC3_9BURK|nr:hypothetical protein C7C56_011060 [Massilia glaciei]
MASSSTCGKYWACIWALGCIAGTTSFSGSAQQLTLPRHSKAARARAQGLKSLNGIVFYD